VLIGDYDRRVSYVASVLEITQEKSEDVKLTDMILCCFIIYGESVPISKACFIKHGEKRTYFLTLCFTKNMLLGLV